MFDWKILAAALVALLALLAALGSHPVVKGFFESVGQKIPVIGAEDFTPGNISFSAAAEKEPFTAAPKRHVNMTIDAKTMSATIKEARINVTGKVLGIKGYSGLIVVDNSSFLLNGTLESFDTGDVFIVRGDVYAAGIYESIEIDGLAMKEFATNKSVVLNYGGNNLFLKNGMKIENLAGKFVFSDKLKIEGAAKRIVSGQIVIS
ncbi:MAG: hypothetical protein HYW26_03605 [Candidatus Aenigmarchaeota archaeon]|nr:hypothetical protein [Candidatus Aenigmarchaeota archaeon]